MMNNDDLIKLGSKTAKDGFNNEHYVVEVFNKWKTSDLAQKWLFKMNYKLEDIEYVKAIKIKGSYKADIQVQIKIIIKLKEEIDCQNIQVKLVSNPQGFNQIDKRWLVTYQELWNIPTKVFELLQYYIGEIAPYKKETKDSRRMLANELTEEEQKLVLCFLNKNKTLIVSDILKGRGQFSAEWMLVIFKVREDAIEWALEPINYVLNYFGNGEIKITEKGNFRIGRITMQRKGGDNGRETAKMLQFKINPAELIKQK